MSNEHFSSDRASLHKRSANPSVDTLRCWPDWPEQLFEAIPKPDTVKAEILINLPTRLRVSATELGLPFIPFNLVYLQSWRGL